MLARETEVTAPFRPDAEQAGKRALGSSLLAMQSRLDGGAAAQAQFDGADNMTAQLSALTSLITIGAADSALRAFEKQWRHDRLVMDKWFAIQVSHARPDQAAQVASDLTERPDFTMKNPNRFRSVFGAFAGHPAGFHQKDGSGYRLLADWLIKLDPINPQITARMSGAFETWKRYDGDRQSLIADQLDRILATPGLSRDTTEMISRIRGA
mgnify:CR=1 FL=1